MLQLPLLPRRDTPIVDFVQDRRAAKLNYIVVHDGGEKPRDFVEHVFTLTKFNTPLRFGSLASRASLTPIRVMITPLAVRI